MVKTKWMLPLTCTLLLAIGAGAAPRQLNSLVTEYVNIRPEPGKTARFELTLDQPSWLYMETDTGPAGVVAIDGQTVLAGSGETMRFVRAERCVVELDLQREMQARRFIVRRIPEIFMYMLEYLDRPRETYHYIHTKAFLEPVLLRHCNVVVSHISEAYAEDAAAWRRQGGKWFANRGMGTLRNPDADLVSYWRAILSRPMFDGVIHDEVLSQDPPHYERWGEAMKEVRATPGLEDKAIYLWTPWGSLGDTDWNQYFALVREDAAEGSVCLRCNASPDRLRSFRQVGITMEPGKTYTLSCRMRVENVEVKHVPGTEGYDGAYSGVFLINTGWHSTCGSLIKPSAEDTTWTQRSRTFRPPESRDGRYELLIVPPARGTMWIDDLRLEAGETAGPENRNLIENGGFESGLEAWNERATKARVLCDIVRENGGKLAIEAYMNEFENEKTARNKIQTDLVARVASMKEGIPGIERHLTICFSAGNGPLRYANDKHPDICYKTHLDMQFHAAVNSAAFEGVSGLGFWTLHYLDEEGARWYGALFRHYLIDGKREPLAPWPYEMNHLENPGFEDGLTGWQPVGAVAAVTRREAFGTRPRGKYAPVPQGNGLLMTSPATQRHNSFSQIARNLKPGTAYVLKCYVADRDWKPLTIPAAITAADADEIADLAETRLWTVRNDDAFWTMHKRVFRAKATQMTLTLSDAPVAALENPPEAVFWDFVQIEPYFER